MTHLCSFETKKALREALARGEDPWLEDPSIFPGALSGRVSEILRARGPVTVTSRRRRWFGRLSWMASGKVRCE